MRRRGRHFIREWRVFRKMSQQKLADRIGTSKTSISRIETNDQSYTQEILEAIAETLGTHPSILLAREPAEADALPAPAARREPVMVPARKAKNAGSVTTFRARSRN